LETLSKKELQKKKKALSKTRTRIKLERRETVLSNCKGTLRRGRGSLMRRTRGKLWQRGEGGFEEWFGGRGDPRGGGGGGKEKKGK